MTIVSAADVVVVGGGISGVMSAYHLARAGRRVLVIERGVIAGEASGRNGGHVHPSTYDPAQRALGLLALDLWPRLVERLELPTEYRQAGAINVVMEHEGERLVGAKQAASERGEPLEVLSPEETRELLPGVAPGIAGALFQPACGNVNPILAAKALAHAARAHGVEIWEGVEVSGVRVARDAVAGVETSRGVVACHTLVNCAGAWAARIGALAGVRVPVLPHRLQIAISEAVGPLTAATFGGNNIYARQALSGQLHFGLLSGPSWDPPLERFDRRVTPGTLALTARRMAELLPGVAGVPLLRSWAGVNSITPDGAPIVGRAPELDGFVVAAGFWNGFGIGVATGQVVSELIVDGAASVDISGLALERFDRYPPEVLYPFERWQATAGAAGESPYWPATGVRVGQESGGMEARDA